MFRERSGTHGWWTFRIWHIPEVGGLTRAGPNPGQGQTCPAFASRVRFRECTAQYASRPCGNSLGRTLAPCTNLLENNRNDRHDTERDESDQKLGGQRASHSSLQDGRCGSGSGDRDGCDRSVEVCLVILLYAPGPQSRQRAGGSGPISRAWFNRRKAVRTPSSSTG